jgi:hypothetical protein
MESWRMGTIATMAVVGGMFVTLVVFGGSGWAYNVERGVSFLIVMLLAPSASRTRTPKGAE